jgi:mRNA-degrading endonuclease RelE of RelBE toxin-antitoxin system
MTSIVVKQMPTFKKVYKKLRVNDKLKVNEAIRALVNNPKIGQEKKGDLSGVFVYKFKIHQREILFAYEWDARRRILLAMGLHENFYRVLKIHR